jgi:hypothetical protein
MYEITRSFEKNAKRHPEEEANQPRAFFESQLDRRISTNYKALHITWRIKQPHLNEILDFALIQVQLSLNIPCRVLSNRASIKRWPYVVNHSQRGHDTAYHSVRWSLIGQYNGLQNAAGCSWGFLHLTSVRPREPGLEGFASALFSNSISCHECIMVVNTIRQ